jgi:prevent-host-death family protein
MPLQYGQYDYLRRENMTKSFSTADIKAHLSEMIGKVVYDHERLVVLRRGKPVAALVSLQDLRRLEALDAAGVEKPEIHPFTRVCGMGRA